MGIKLFISALMALVCYLVGSYAYADLASGSFSLTALATSWPQALDPKNLRNTWPFWVSWAGMAAVWIFLLAQIWSEKMKLFGEARWATNGEMSRGKLLGEEGIIIGRSGPRHNSKLIMAPGQEPVMLAAPTRSGKGQGVVLPNCVNWPGSLVNLDVKTENYKLSAGFRKECGQEVYFWNPAADDQRTHGHNFLAYIDTDSHTCINDVQQLSYWLLPTSDEKSKFWEGNSRQLFQAVTLLVLFVEPLELRHLGTVQRYVMHPEGMDWLVQRLRHAAENNIAVPHTATELILRFVKLPAETREGIIGQYQSATELLNNPVTLASLSRHDFDLRDLRRKPMTVYVCMTPEDRERLKPLLSLFFQQLISSNTKELPENPGAGQVKVLLLLDEFASLGRIDAIKNGVAYLAGYNIRMLTIIQSPSQLRDPAVYGNEGAESIISNHPYRMVFRTLPNQYRDADEISKSLGTDTKRRFSSSTSTGNQRTSSQSVSDHGRPLLLPQEISSLDPARCVIFTPHLRPILAYKVVARMDKQIAKRMSAAPPEIPVQAIDEWRSVDFTLKALEKLGVPHAAGASPAAAAASSVAEAPGDDLFKPGEVASWIAAAGGDAMTDNDAEDVAKQMLERLGVKF